MLGTSDLKAFNVFQTLFFSEEIGQQEDNEKKKAENKASVINIAVGTMLKFSLASFPSFYFL